MAAGGPGLGRREQVAVALLAGAALLVTGRLMWRRPAEPLAMLVGSPTPQMLLVHVAGEVLVAGVYRLPAGARWSDAVRAARGPTFLADLHAVNLAQPLRDGDRVLIPRVPDPAPPEVDAATAPAGTRPAVAAGGPVDLNAANAADLEALPGIGPVLANRIVEHRRVHGRFERLEDLLEVEGVGPKLLARLRPRLRVR